MSSKIFVRWSLAFIAVGVATMNWSHAESETPDSGVMGLVEAARMTLKGTREYYHTGNATAEDLYRWSKRTADVEHAALIGSAYTDHLKRMQDLQSYVKSRSEQGTISDFEVSAANYYVAEATIQAGQ